MDNTKVEGQALCAAVSGRLSIQQPNGRLGYCADYNNYHHQATNNWLYQFMCLYTD